MKILITHLYTIIIFCLSLPQLIAEEKKLSITGAKLEYSPISNRSISYREHGKWYRTLSEEGSRNYRQQGIASYYGGKFNGRKTANGEIFNENLYTAAHKTLAFGTFVLVTNLDNGRKIVVRINDRGPYIKSNQRILDLSKKAARSLGMLNHGTARIRAEAFSIDRNGYFQGQAVKSLQKIAKSQGVRLKTHPIDYRPPFPTDGHFIRVEKLKSLNEALELGKKIIARTRVLSNGKFYDLIASVGHEDEIEDYVKTLAIFTHNKISSYFVKPPQITEGWHLHITNLTLAEAKKLSLAIKPKTETIKNGDRYDLYVALENESHAPRIIQQLKTFTHQEVRLNSPKK